MTVSHIPGEITFWDEISQVWRIYTLVRSDGPSLSLPKPEGAWIVDRPQMAQVESDGVGLSD